MRVEFRICGSGGQGVISAGILLAGAAIDSGLYVIQSQSYGPEARGGASKAEVVVSDEPIDYPKATVPDYVLCLTEAAYEAYGRTAAGSSAVLADVSAVPEQPGREVICAPILQTAAGISSRSANVAAVAFLSGWSGIGTEEGLLHSLKRKFPKAYEINAECARAGFRLAEETRGMT